MRPEGASWIEEEGGWWKGAGVQDVPGERQEQHVGVGEEEET